MMSDRFLTKAKAGAAMSALMLAATGCCSKTTQPNIIFILTDDMGYADVGCYGGNFVPTPNIDRMATDGLRFTQYYSASPISSASRTGLLTGMHPGMWNITSYLQSRAGNRDAEMADFLNPEAQTLPRTLKTAGYKTGHFGKWHLGYSNATMPNAQGFDESFGHMGGCIDNYSHYFFWDGPNRHDLWKNGKEVFEPGQYYPQRVTDECISFIEQNREKPFFIYLAYNVPHYPLQPTMDILEQYRSIKPLDVLFAGKWNSEQRVDNESSLAVRTLYSAFVSSMDQQIGRVVRCLKDQGLSENTIIVFQADQGHSFEVRSFFGGGWAGPYRGGKFSLFEGGIRVPSVISWPATLPENKVCSELVHANDWLPTLASFCDISVPDNIDLDGKNIRQCIEKNAPSPHEALYWHLNKQWAVRKGDWKLYVNATDPSTNNPMDEKDSMFMLIDLKNDPGERTNLAEKYPEIVEQLKDIQKNYQKRIP